MKLQKSTKRRCGYEDDKKGHDRPDGFVVDTWDGMIKTDKTVIINPLDCGPFG